MRGAARKFQMIDIADYDVQICVLSVVKIVDLSAFYKQRILRGMLTFALERLPLLSAFGQPLILTERGYVAGFDVYDFRLVAKTPL